MQWAVDPYSKRYNLIGGTVPHIPPGYYSLEITPAGNFFIGHDVKQEKLITSQDTVASRVIDEIKLFWTLESKYRKAGLPYKRGILLYGPPGTGKSCTIQLIVEDVVENRKGFVMDFTNPRVIMAAVSYIRSTEPAAPFVILMEDLESIMENYDESQVLNFLDGINQIHNIIFLASTNYPDKLPPRIKSRPSRFDRRFLVGNPSSEARRHYLDSLTTRFGEPLTEEALNKWVADTNELAYAHIKELFISVALLGNSYEDSLKTIQEMKEAIVLEEQ